MGGYVGTEPARVAFQSSDIADNIVTTNHIANTTIARGDIANGVIPDITPLESNIALAAFQVQSANDLAKFNLIDQIVDEYKDDSGISSWNNTQHSPQSGATDSYLEMAFPATAGDATSIKTDALVSPSYGSIVMLMENWGGVAVLGTNIKAWVSRNNGSNWYEATGDYALTDKGSWGESKKIITANNIPFAGPSGTEMCYKIEWDGQSIGFMETRIHATSLAWK